MKAPAVEPRGDCPAATRVELLVGGCVQGVGFRPFVYRQATKRGLSGHVQNAARGVRIEVEGEAGAVGSFIRALASEAPEGCSVQVLRQRELPPSPERRTPFEIRPSTRDVSPTAVLGPDRAPCDACVEDIRAGRRASYPLTTCAACGPRFSIIERLPFDRDGTSMRAFSLCEHCQREYDSPEDRRFHAETIACAACGPQVRFTPLARGDVRSSEPAPGDDPMARAAALLLSGGILGLMGVGGYQLLADATSEPAVQQLRARKHRRARPFAVLFDSLGSVRDYALLDPQAQDALTSPAAPIALVPAREDRARLAPSVSMGSPLIGAMLPASPLHHLLAHRTQRPLVCTSGNASGEPLCIDTEEARVRLAGVADALLHHDRRIVRPLDDSVVRPGVGVLRRARGLCPAPIAAIDTDRTILALGAHLKSAVTLVTRGEAVLGPHLGDLESARTRALLERSVEDMLRLFDVTPDVIACDLHPDYASTVLAEQLALRFGARLLRVQHHHAHVAAVMVEHRLDRPVSGLAWDGTGLGTDGTVWGGEAIVIDPHRWRAVAPATSGRVGGLRPFPLVGGNRAAREGFRSALGHAATLGPEVVAALAPRFFETEATRAAFSRALDRPALSIPCSSIGRLFDAVAALSGLAAVSAYEGQAAAQLEFAALRATTADRSTPAYPMGMLDGTVDPRPLIAAVMDDAAGSVPVEIISWRLHRALALAARYLAETCGQQTVALSGGCFQNRVLSDLVQSELADAGFKVLRPAAVPVNDGGISLGQARIAALAFSAGRIC